MANLLKNMLNESTVKYKQQLAESKGLARKWAKSGLLNGLASDTEQMGMAVLLENQAKQLIKEANSTGVADNAEQWSGVALPLVRRIFGTISTKQFVSVQPMSLPSGLVFYLDFKYGTDKAGFKTLSQRAQNADPRTPGYQESSVYGVSNTTGSAYGGFFGGKTYGYSMPVKYVKVDGVTPTELTLTDSEENATEYTNALGVFNYDERIIDALNANGQKAYEIKISDASTKLFYMDPAAVGAFDLTSNDMTTGVTTTYNGAALVPQALNVLRQYTKYDANTDTITFVAIGTDTPTVSCVAYYVQPTAERRGDYEDPLNYTWADTDGEAKHFNGDPTDNNNYVSEADMNVNPSNLLIPEFDLDIRSLPIVAKTRKLKARWTPEVAQDLNAYHSIDAENEMTGMMSDYIAQEIDFEILDMLMNAAVTTDYWSAKIGYDYNPATGRFETLDGTLKSAYVQGTWFQTLGTKMQKVSNAIAQKTMKSGANFAIVSPAVATVLESIPGYAADTNGEKNEFAMGVTKVGALNNRWTIYKNPYLTSNVILMGYKGPQFLDAGAVFCPYVPLISTPVVYDVDNFTPHKGLMTRYAKMVLRPEFYGKIIVGGLSTL